MVDGVNSYLICEGKPPSYCDLLALSNIVGV